jgi:hypothetical protein
MGWGRGGPFCRQQSQRLCLLLLMQLLQQQGGSGPDGMAHVRKGSGPFLFMLDLLFAISKTSAAAALGAALADAPPVLLELLAAGADKLYGQLIAEKGLQLAALCSAASDVLKGRLRASEGLGQLLFRQMAEAARRSGGSDNLVVRVEAMECCKMMVQLVQLLLQLGLLPENLQQAQLVAQLVTARPSSLIMPIAGKDSVQLVCLKLLAGYAAKPGPQQAAAVELYESTLLDQCRVSGLGWWAWWWLKGSFPQQYY